jgi:hypothetical protein
MIKNKALLGLLFALFTLLGGLQSQDNVTDLRKANKLLSVAQERDRLAAEALDDVKSYRQRLEEDLTDLQDNKNAKVERKKLETEIKGLLKKEGDLEQRRKFANNLLLDVTDILNDTPKKRARFIQEYEKRFGPIKLVDGNSNGVVTQNVPQNVPPQTPPSVSTPKIAIDPVALLEKENANPPQIIEEPQIVSTTPLKDSKKKKKETPKKPKKETPSVISETSNTPPNEAVAEVSESKKAPEKPKKEKKTAPEKAKAESSKTAINYKKYDIKDDVMNTTPSNSDCTLAYDGMDNFTGKKKQETIPIVLFTHTDDFMRPAMKNKEFVTCEATATRVEGSRTVYINLTLTIQSKDAQRTFGFLDRGSMIIFRFINGKKVNLTTNKTDIGAVDVDKGTTTFRAQLAILESIELTASELDAIRVSWSVGYEDYEIYDMDVLRNLFKCLDKK